MKVWLVGAGNQAAAYAKVLNHLAVPFNVIGRGQVSALHFKRKTGKPAYLGGVGKALKELDPPHTAIVATTVDQLFHIAGSLTKAGTKRILLEKPGALNLNEITRLHRLSQKHKNDICIGYNRRFYASTQQARQQIHKDGGVTSCVFELTEWAQSIRSWSASKEIKNALFLANSSHVADLAFYLCGKPDDWQGWVDGGLSWHKRSARFCGGGITERGALFSYHADWEAPGRWGVEICTRRKRYILRPLEKLFIQTRGANCVREARLATNYDEKFKAGLYLQTKAFLQSDFRELCSLEEQVKMMAIYSKMAGYKN